MRLFGTIVLAAVLAACSKGEEAKGGAAAKQAASAAEEKEDPSVRCALAGAKAFKPDCTREIAQGDDGEVWVIHHPDGSFRRFVLIDKGTRIATADGAEEVRTERQGPDLEVRVGGNRYLFPAAPESPAPGPSAHASAN